MHSEEAPTHAAQEAFAAELEQELRDGVAELSAKFRTMTDWDVLSTSCHTKAGSYRVRMSFIPMPTSRGTSAPPYDHRRVQTAQAFQNDIHVSHHDQLPDARSLGSGAKRGGTT